MALERWAVKALCMFGLFGSMLIFVLLPIRVSKAVERQGKKGLFVISILTCFGGGVFFGAYLTHLSPEVRAVLEVSLLEPNGIAYPLPELLAGAGFFLILFIEKFVLWLQTRSERKARKDKKGQQSSAIGSDDGELASMPYEVGIKMTGAAFINNGYNESTAVGRLIHGEESRSRSNSKGENRSRRNSRGDSRSRSNSKDLEPKDLKHIEFINANGVGLDGDHRQYSDEVKIAINPSMNPDGASVSSASTDIDFEGGQARSIIFIIALSLDSIFEGLAMGLKENTIDVINIFVAIISHEFIMSFCIGLELVKYNKTKKVVGAGIVYAFTPVFGAIIGTSIIETKDSMMDQNTIETVSGILQCISAGTFIYCTFIGILSGELTHDTGFYKALATLVGFGLMAGMAAIPEDAAGEDIMSTMFPPTTV